MTPLATLACPRRALDAGHGRPLVGHRSWRPAARVLAAGGDGLDGWPGHRWPW